MNLSKNLEKIFNAFGNLENFPKTILKYRIVAFSVLFFTGTALVLLNNLVLEFDSYLDLVSKSLVKVSFSIAAEVIIASVVIDYLFKK